MPAPGTDAPQPREATPGGPPPVAIVTGASRGIGRAVVERLSAEGWRVGAIDRELPAPGAGDDPARVHSVCADVRDAAQLAEATAAVVARFGRLDAVVANAAIGGPDGVFAELPLDAIREVMDINYFGAAHAVRAAVPHIRAYGGRGRIVLLGSLFAQQPVPGAAPYISSKGAVQGLMHALALELAPAMTVNSIAPGYIMTDMHREELAFRAQRAGTSFDAQAAAVRALIPLERHGSPADIAAGVSFLLSEAAGYITGQTLNINGGVQIS